MSAESTTVSLLTPIAHIRWFLVLRAEFFLEVFADCEAVCATLRTFLGPLKTAAFTDISAVLTGVPIEAGVKPAAAIFDDEMIPDFL